MTARRGLSAAVVGAGLMGRWHARAVRHAGGVVAAVVDRDSQLAARLAAEHGAVVAPSLRDAMSAGVDIAHICTPLDTHVAITREAIRLGLHSLVEKPLAASATETSELLREAAERRVLVCPVHQFPFQRGMSRVMAALPGIGPVLHLQAIACSAGGLEGGADTLDRVAADILPHPLSLFASVLGVSLANVQWSAVRPRPGELLVSGEAGNATLSLIVSMTGRPTTNGLNVIGAGGTAHADLFHGFAVIESGGVSRARKIAHPFMLAGATLVDATGNLARRALVGETAYPGLRELITAFYSAVRAKAPSPIAADRIHDLALARDAILREV